MSNKATNQLAALVVDDEPDYAELLAAVLESEGYSVEFAVDGIDAFERVQTRRPDVITLDVQMPRKGGIQFYRELRSNPKYAEIPIVVVTGITRDDRDMETFVRAFLEVDHLPMPDAYLEKPIDNKKFVQVVGDSIRTA